MWEVPVQVFEIPIACLTFAHAIGKTISLLGENPKAGALSKSANPAQGILSGIAHILFRSEPRDINEKVETQENIKLNFSCMQIYCERIEDLLIPEDEIEPGEILFPPNNTLSK